MGEMLAAANAAWEQHKIEHPLPDPIGDEAWGYVTFLSGWQARDAHDVLGYIMARFPDLEWSEHSDPITALCDRLEAAEARP